MLAAKSRSIMFFLVERLKSELRFLLFLWIGQLANLLAKAASSGDQLGIRLGRIEQGFDENPP